MAIEKCDKCDKPFMRLDLHKRMAHACSCENYDGDSFECTMHTPRTECPNCKCVDAEKEINGALAPMKQLQCTICGSFYMRNFANGEYLYER